MLLNYRKWKALNEQSDKPYISGSGASYYPTDPESKEIIKLFFEYIETLLPNYLDTPINELIIQFKSISDDQLAGAINWFNSHGYKQPGDPRIIKLQQGLMKSTDITQFTTNTSKTSKFDDGTLGAATSRVILTRKIEIWEKLGNRFNKAKTLRQHGEMHKAASIESDKKGIIRRTPAVAPKTKIGANLKLDIGTQKIR